MKYIILYDEIRDQHIPLIFPDMLVHADVAKSITRALPNPTYPVAAGEISVGILGYECHGFSETLKLQSRPQDASIINSMDYCHGLMHDPTPIPYQPRKPK